MSDEPVVNPKREGGSSHVRARLQARIENQDEFTCLATSAALIERLQSDRVAGRGFAEDNIEAQEESATAALEQAFPEFTEALAAAHSERDPWTQARFARAFLLTYLSEVPDADLERLEEALDYADEQRVEPAALPPVLLAVGIVMLLQLRFDVDYERTEGKGHLKVSVSKKPTSETMIGKVLGSLLGN